MTGCKSSSVACQQPLHPEVPGSKLQDSASTLNRLTVATGGTEKSWYRCIFPFGIVALVIGIAATSITFTFNVRELKSGRVVSVVVLVFGICLILAAFACWRVRREKRRKKEANVSMEQGTQ